MDFQLLHKMRDYWHRKKLDFIACAIGLMDFHDSTKKTCLGVFQAKIHSWK